MFWLFGNSNVAHLLRKVKHIKIVVGTLGLDIDFSLRLRAPPGDVLPDQHPPEVASPSCLRPTVRLADSSTDTWGEAEVGPLHDWSAWHKAVISEARQRGWKVH